MIKTIGGLILRTIVVLLGTATLTFALLWNAPGDPAQAIAMARFDALLTQDVVDQVREEVGLNRSFWPSPSRLPSSLRNARAVGWTGAPLASRHLETRSRLIGWGSSSSSS